VIAILLGAFILYLYTPHLLFKYFAATKYDFITRKELPQIEEFFAAGLPGLFLNAFTWSALWVTYRLVGASPIVIDREIVARVFTKDPDLSAYIAKGDISALVCYVGALAVLSALAGRVYGNILVRVAMAGGDGAYLQQPSSALSFLRHRWPQLTRRFVVIVRAVGVLYLRLWHLFYAQYEHPLYHIVLRQTLAFVHTTHGLYHGFVYQFDKKRDGEVDGIYIIKVSRFSRKKEKDCFEMGINPISDLSGPLFIKWEEIIDINYPPSESVLAAKRAEYEVKLVEYADAAKKAQVATNPLADPPVTT
jgi:hypothetical protein